MRWRGGGCALCDGARVSGGSPLYRNILFLQRVVRHFWWSDANRRHDVNERVANGSGLVCAGVIAGRARFGDLAATGSLSSRFERTGRVTALVRNIPPSGGIASD